VLIVRQVLIMIAGTFVYSFGLNYFLIANHLAEGGFVGLSILVLYTLHIPLGLTYLALNIPLFFVAWRYFGSDIIWRSIIGVAGISLFSYVTRHLQMPIPDRLLAALYGGVCCGIGLGLIFRTGSTTGGSDIIARLLRRFRGMNMGSALFAIDVCVIATIAIVIGKDVAMYSLVSLFVTSRVVDFVLEGSASSKAAFIISDQAKEISDKIQVILDRGTTLLTGKGGHGGAEKKVIYCVVSREEVVRLQRLANETDPTAFVVISDVHDVSGEGFQR